MVSARQRTKVAALSLAAASLGSNHAVDAFYSAAASPLAFAPLQAQPWLAPSLAGRRSTTSLSATGRPHRLHVRGRSGLESSSCWRSERPAGVSVSRGAACGTWGGALGSRRGSKLLMAVDDDTGETSASAVSLGNAFSLTCFWMTAGFCVDCLGRERGATEVLKIKNQEISKFPVTISGLIVDHCRAQLSCTRTAVPAVWPCLQREYVNPVR